MYGTLVHLEHMLLIGILLGKLGQDVLKAPLV